jgi:hypothetical protein
LLYVVGVDLTKVGQDVQNTNPHFSCVERTAALVVVLGWAGLF